MYKGKDPRRIRFKKLTKKNKEGDSPTPSYKHLHGNPHHVICSWSLLTFIHSD